MDANAKSRARQFRANVRKARDRVAGMDKIDGYADRNPRTILAALQCGLTHPDTGAQFEAFVMLQDFCSLFFQEATNGQESQSPQGK